MENSQKTPPTISIIQTDDSIDQNTPPLLKLDNIETSQSPIKLKIETPDRLKVPKPFKYPERYSSPTDQMMSPITRGILARNNRKLLPPSVNQLKIQALHLQESDVSQIGSIEV